MYQQTSSNKAPSSHSSIQLPIAKIKFFFFLSFFSFFLHSFFSSSLYFLKNNFTLKFLSTSLHPSFPHPSFPTLTPFRSTRITCAFSRRMTAKQRPPQPSGHLSPTPKKNRQKNFQPLPPVCLQPQLIQVGPINQISRTRIPFFEIDKFQNLPFQIS